MSERYRFTHRDAELLWAASVLLRKVTGSGKIRPAQMVTLAKLQHILSVLPRTTEGVTASVSVSSAPRTFGEIETHHWWEFGIEDDRLKITCGGHFYRPSTGGDTFTTMIWEAIPGLPSVLEDYSEMHRIVPDLRSFAEGVDSIDLSSGSYSLAIDDNDNALLEDHDDDELESADEIEETVEEESTDTSEVPEADVEEPWSITPVDAFETWIATQVDPQQIDAREAAYSYGVEECGLCGCDLNNRGLHVDGRIRGNVMWSNMCAECFKNSGEGIGWGKGQLYARQPNGDWRLIAGFRPEE
jgi:hypothetical protein